MKNIKNWLVENDYLEEPETTIFSVRLQQVLENNFLNSVLNRRYFIHALIKYPKGWPKDLNLFQFFSRKTIKKLRNKECFFVFDASAEGLSPFKENWFDILYQNCKKYSVDPKQIIFVSSNLKDEKNLKKYLERKKTFPPIHVISFTMFENCINLNDDPKKELSKSIISTENNFQEKYFSSLSRLKRQHRIISQFLLSHHKIGRYALISQDKLYKNELDLCPLFEVFSNYNKDQVIKWNKFLPLTIDQTDFKKNWAIEGTFSHIHDQTLFQLVNETTVDNLCGTSLFYSEKTFRPIANFQPFVIFGQPGCNHYLKDLGFELYDDWFDLEFDYEENYIIRYSKILKSLEKVCRNLETMNRTEQINWKFKNKEKLIHNYNCMKDQNLTKSKIQKLIKKLQKQIKNH